MGTWVLGGTHTPHTTRVGWSLVFAANPVNTVNFILTLRVRTTKVPIWDPSQARTDFNVSDLEGR